MKNLYPKGGSKGRIHPSPGNPSAAAAAAAASSYDTLLRLLLPTFILALTAVLSDQDKEVVAYLINTSKKLSDSYDRRKSSAIAGTAPSPSRAHQAKFDCDCFDCYTSFWSRWDASPNREIIHQTIEAYEEHLSSSERRSDRRRRVGGEKQEKSKKSKGKKAIAAAAEEGPPSPAAACLVSVEFSPPAMASAIEDDRRLDDVGNGEEVAAAERQQMEPATGVDGERRRWPDVIGMISRWSLWGPGV